MRSKKNPSTFRSFFPSSSSQPTRARTSAGIISCEDHGSSITRYYYPPASRRGADAPANTAGFRRASNGLEIPTAPLLHRQREVIAAVTGYGEGTSRAYSNEDRALPGQPLDVNLAPHGIDHLRPSHAYQRQELDQRQHRNLQAGFNGSVNMANPQYSFPPPPPAPPSAHGYQHHPQAQYPYAQQQPHFQQSRGGFHGRGAYTGPPPQHGYTGPPPVQAAGAPYDPRNPAPYIGPQPPRPMQNGPVHQPAPQWQMQHHPQMPPHGQPMQPTHGAMPGMQAAPNAVPLSAQNYHPNYAPQAYRPPQQQAPGPQYQPQAYPPSMPTASPQPPQQWSSPTPYNPPQFAARGRGRGGGAGGPSRDVPLMGPPIRMGFDNERNGSPQASNAFTPPSFPQPSPAIPFTPPYQAYSPALSVGSRPSFDSPQLQAAPFRGGRGGQHAFRGKGRGDAHMQRGNRRFSSQQAESPKAAGADLLARRKNKKKRLTNTLGLTPNGAEHEESEDEVDDMDEESRLVTLLGPDTPQLPDDLAAWLAERKAAYPTKARREAAAEAQRKAAEEADRVKKEQELKLENETELEKQQRRAEKLRAELEKAERKIQDTLSGGKRKREDGDEGEGEAVSDSGSEPETASSRPGGPTRVAAPPKAQLQRHCKYFSTGGTCGKKGKCRFVHDQEVRDQALRDKEANGGKMTLAQRLILNDTAKDDLTILKSIKYLKEKGKITEGSTPNIEGAVAEDVKADDEDAPNGVESTYADESQYGEV